MAIKQAFEALDGRQIDNCYWTQGQINIGVLDETGQITMVGHADGAARAAGKAPVAGAMRPYPFSREQFYAAQLTDIAEFYPEWETLTLADIFPDQDLGAAGSITIKQIADLLPHFKLYDVLARFGYREVKMRKDVDTGEKDEDGKPIMVSFFAEAEDV
jgi:hypothetical protein